jgi:hypothetical protein
MLRGRRHRLFAIRNGGLCQRQGASQDRQIAWLDSTGQTKALQGASGHLREPEILARRKAPNI